MRPIRFSGGILLFYLILTLSGCDSVKDPVSMDLEVNLGDSETLLLQNTLSKMPNLRAIWSTSMPAHTQIRLCFEGESQPDNLSFRITQIWDSLKGRFPDYAELTMAPNQLSPHKIADIDLRKIKQTVSHTEIKAFTDSLSAIEGMLVSGMPAHDREIILVPDFREMQNLKLDPDEVRDTLEKHLKKGFNEFLRNFKSITMRGDTARGDVPITSCVSIVLAETNIPDFISLAVKGGTSRSEQASKRSEAEAVMVKFLVLNSLTTDPGMMAFRPWNDRRPVRYEFEGESLMELREYVAGILQKLGSKLEENEVLESPVGLKNGVKVTFDFKKIAAYKLNVQEIRKKVYAVREHLLAEFPEESAQVKWDPFHGNKGIENLQNLGVSPEGADANICVKDLAMIEFVPEVRRVNLKQSLSVYIWGPQGSSIMTSIEATPLPEGIRRTVGETDIRFPDFWNPGEFR